MREGENATRFAAQIKEDLPQVGMGGGVGWAGWAPAQTCARLVGGTAPRPAWPGPLLFNPPHQALTYCLDAPPHLLAGGGAPHLR